MAKREYRIKPCYSIVVHSPNQVELRKGVWNSASYTLNDDSTDSKLAKIILDINGNNSLAEIANRHNVKRSDIEGIIDHLRRLDVLEIESSNLMDFYLEEAKLPFPGIDPNRKQPVVFLGDEKINELIAQQITPYCLDSSLVKILQQDDPISRMLTEKIDESEQELSFLRNCKLMESLKGSLIIYTTNFINPPLLLKFNRLAYETGIDWMHGCIDGPMIYAGPLFFSEKGPCYFCFEKRISMNIMENNSYVEYKKALIKNDVTSNPVISSLMKNLLASHMSIEIVNYILTKNSFLCNRVLSMYLPTKEIGYNELLRFPSCPVCGSVKERDACTTYFDKEVVLEEG